MGEEASNLLGSKELFRPYYLSILNRQMHFCYYSCFAMKDTYTQKASVNG